MTTCRSCGAAIRWEKTARGKSMPLDAEPVADGELYVEGGVARYIGLDLALFDGPRYRSHFASCPNSAQHRKPKEKRAR